MGQIHELLAAEKSVEDQFKKVLGDITNTFLKKPDRFLGTIRTLHMFDDASQNENTTEVKEIDSTVEKELQFLKDYAIKYIDLIAQKESSNQSAFADVIIDGKIILEQVPATLLLALESKLSHLRVMYDAIPTLQPGINWVEDAEKGKGIYKNSNPEESFKTQKDIIAKILWEPTDPKMSQKPEIEKISVDKKVGKYITTQFSGMISKARKAEILSKLDTLIVEIKKARQRANSTECSYRKVAETIFDFINN